MLIPTNVYQLRFTDASDTLNNVILYISRILKPGVANLRTSIISNLTKMLEKIIGLAAVVIALCPGQKIEDQVYIYICLCMNLLAFILMYYIYY